MGGHSKLYTGPRIPCGWPECPKTLKNQGSLHDHWNICFGHTLPPLATGIKCDIVDCCCLGVDFPSVERLTRHKNHQRKAAANLKKQKQCLSPVCGCGHWFKDLASHLRSVKRKQSGNGPLIEKGLQQYLGSTWKKRGNSLSIGVEDEAENDDVGQHLGEGQITGSEIKKEVEDDDGEVLGLQFVHSDNGIDSTSKPTQATKRKRDNDDIGDETAKKVRVNSSVVPSQAEPSLSGQTSGMVSNLLEIIKSQQDTIQLQQLHIELLTGSALKRK